MKKVFSSNSQLAHIWANQLQSEGRGNSMFFYDGIIYSYGMHYEIAQIINKGNTRFYFINSNGYSNSTAKHTNHVCNSIARSEKTYFVPFINNKFSIESLPAIIEKMRGNVNELLAKQIKAKSNFTFYSQALRRINTMTDICEFFGLPVINRAHFELYREAKEKAEILENTQQQREAIKRQKEAEKEKELLKKWLINEYHGALYNTPVNLRMTKDGKTLQTSKGASVPMDEAKEFLFKLKLGTIKRGDKIGGFTFIEDNGHEITIGCHVITWEVINKFFNL